MMDKLQERSSLGINYFMYTLISCVPVSNTRTHLAACLQEKPGIHIPKHMRCRPKSCHQMHLLSTLFFFLSVTKILCFFNGRFVSIYVLCTARSDSNTFYLLTQTKIFITICLSKALHSYCKIFDPEKGDSIFLRNFKTSKARIPHSECTPL